MRSIMLAIALFMATPVAANAQAESEHKEHACIVTGSSSSSLSPTEEEGLAEKLKAQKCGAGDVVHFVGMWGMIVPAFCDLNKTVAVQVRPGPAEITCVFIGYARPRSTINN